MGLAGCPSGVAYAKKPSREQILRFIECFDTVCRFEAMIQMTRGMSAFRDGDWPDKPDKAVLAVLKWLADEAECELPDAYQ